MFLIIQVSLSLILSSYLNWARVILRGCQLYSFKQIMSNFYDPPQQKFVRLPKTKSSTITRSSTFASFGGQHLEDCSKQQILDSALQYMEWELSSGNKISASFAKEREMLYLKGLKSHQEQLRKRQYIRENKQNR